MFKNFHSSLELLEESTRSDIFRSECSDSESTQSTPEEEKIRRLFSTCDRDGDGYITSDDILSICKQLNLEFSPEEIMRQLGSDETGKVSFDDFLKRRLELLDEMKSQANSVRSSDDEYMWTCNYQESWRNESPDFNLEGASAPCSVPLESHELDNENIQWINSGSGRGSDSASHSLEASSSAKRESSSCDYDSGAHDLEMEQVSLQKLLENSGVTVPQEKGDVIEIANKFHQNVLHSIKLELNEVNNRLQLVLKERDLLEKQITSTKRDHTKIVKEIEKRRQRDNLRYEDRITELSSVVAELSEKLEHQHYNVFNEEDEYFQPVDLNFPDGELNKLCTATPVLVSGDKSSPVENVSLNLDIQNKIKVLHKLDDHQGTKRKSDLSTAEEIEASNSSLVQDIDFSFQKCIEIIGSSLDKSQVAEFIRLEIEKLKYKLLHTQSQLDLARIHLDESKENAERLTVLLGKFEANNTALQLAMSYSDTVFESWRVSNDLKDAEMGLLLASCRAAGLGKLLNISEEEDKEEVINILNRAREKRAKAEEEALNFVRSLRSDGHSEVNQFAKFTKEDEALIVQQRGQHEKDIAAIRSSLVDVEPLHKDQEATYPILRASSSRSPKVDLENVVMIQELMALKEEKADLRSQMFILQKELNASNLQSGTARVLQESYDVELERLRSERKLRRHQECSSGGSAGLEENENYEDHVHELLMSLSQVTKNYEQRIEEYQSALKASKKANSNLKLKLDRIRRKNDERIKKSETHIKPPQEDERRRRSLDQNLVKRISKETTL